MFDHIVLNRSINGPSLTVGEIAEAILFYQSVHIIMDRSTLAGLIHKIGHHNVLKLLSYPHVKATYIEEFLGVHTIDSPYGPEYSLISAYISGGESVGDLKSSKKRLEYMLYQNGLSNKQAESFSSRFKNCVTFKSIANDHFIKGGVIAAATNDFLDTEYVLLGTRVIAKNLLGDKELPDNYYFKVHMNNGSFRASTNLDFSMVNVIQKNRDKNCGEYTPAHIASSLLNASYGLILAAHYGGDFYTSEVESEIIQLKNKHILTRAHLNRSIQNQFSTILLDGCPDLSSVLNTGERSFEEFLELLSKANNFKKWLKGKSPDENLVSNYIDDISSSGWINQTPSKIIRYLTSTSLGFAGPITGVVASAIDTFLLDKFCSGWKPNQFINKKLKPFVSVTGDD